MNLSSNRSRKKDLNEFMGMCDSISHLVVSIFKIDTQKFIYYSESVDDILGYCPDRLRAGGWELWYSFLNSSERPVIEHKLSEFITRKSVAAKKNSLILKYHIKSAIDEKVCLKHKVSPKCFASEEVAVSYISDRSEKERVENYLVNLKNRTST